MSTKQVFQSSPAKATGTRSPWIPIGRSLHLPPKIDLPHNAALFGKTSPADRTHRQEILDGPSLVGSSSETNRDGAGLFFGPVEEYPDSLHLSSSDNSLDSSFFLSGSEKDGGSLSDLDPIVFRINDAGTVDFWCLLESCKESRDSDGFHQTNSEEGSLYSLEPVSEPGEDSVSDTPRSLKPGEDSVSQTTPRTPTPRTAKKERLRSKKEKSYFPMVTFVNIGKAEPPSPSRL